MTYQPQMLEPPLTRWCNWNEVNKYGGSHPQGIVSPEIPTCVFVISLHVCVCVCVCVLCFDLNQNVV